MQYLESDIGYDFGKLRAIQNEWDFAGATDFPFWVWNSYLFSAKPTDFGKRVPWVSSTSSQTEFSPIEVSGFPAGFSPEDYWQRIPQGTRIDWGTLVAAHDIYVSVELLKNGWSDFAGAENVKEANQCVDNLYAEAVANKHGTIPKRALVELQFGPFCTF